MDKKINYKNGLDWDSVKKKIKLEKTSGIGLPDSLVTVTPAKSSPIQSNVMPTAKAIVRPPRVFKTLRPVDYDGEVTYLKTVATTTKDLQRIEKSKEKFAEKRRKELKAAEKRYLERQARKVRKQQIKLLETMQRYERSIKALAKTSNSVQTKICDHLKTRNEMKVHQVSADVAKLLKKPDPWQRVDETELGQYSSHIFSSGLFY